MSHFCKYINMLRSSRASMNQRLFSHSCCMNNFLWNYGPKEFLMPLIKKGLTLYNNGNKKSFA